MAQTTQSGGAEPEPINDYRVERDAAAEAPPPSHRVLSVINGFLLIVLAGVSFALFWIVATMIGFI